MSSAELAPPRWKIIAAFASVYVWWGSTYLAIRYAVETLPPFMTAGVRFLTAGSILWFFARLTGADKPTRLQWREASIVGTFLLLGGNGSVMWAEQYMPSGLAALMIATTPLFMTALDWLIWKGPRPGLRVCLGLLLGFSGIFLLIRPWEEHTHGAGEAKPIDLAAAAALVFATLSWSCGSLYGKRADAPKNPLLTSGMQMLVGGAVMLTVGLALGEWKRIDPSLVSARSLWSVLHLIVFGSLVGFSCFSWLIRVAQPAKVATYAYVNPVVAVFLGWAIAGETLTGWAILAAAVILSGVVLIVTGTPAKVEKKPDAAPHQVPDAEVSEPV